ncbi:MAG TPA: hypothetical protein VL443_29905 [Cyclobacteriaceae bacterium]|jgi:hypothetical protein|nr:hypothetical protein [Cyclobacteriaceae bacterium]
MKKILLLFLPFACLAQVTPDATTKTNINNNIRNATTVTRANHAAIEDALNYSKLSRVENNVAYGTDTYTLTVGWLTTYQAGDLIPVTFTDANTGAATININGLGAKAIKKNVSSALSSGDIAAGEAKFLFYDGTNFQLLGGAGGSGTVTSVSATSPIFVTSPTTTPNITIQQANTSQNGYLSNTDWNTFNGKENALTFSSPLSRSVNTISIPSASGSVNGYLSSTDWTTFNGKQSVLSGTGYVKFSGTTPSYISSIPNSDLTNSSINIAGNSTSLGATVTQDNITGLSSTGLIKRTGANTLAIATAGTDYITGNQTISLSGDVSGSGSTAITTAIGASKVTNTMLAGSIADGKLASSYLYADGTRALSGTWASQNKITATNIGIGTGSTMPLGILQTVETATSTPRGIIHDQYNSGTNSSRVYLRKARGTFGSPTVITTGDALGNIVFSGHDGTNFTDAAQFLVTSSGTISTGVVQSTMALQTANSSGTLTTGLSLDGSQNVSIPKLTNNGGFVYTNGSGQISQTSAPVKGDIVYASAANTPALLTVGSNGQVLTSNSSGVPAWSDIGKIQTLFLTSNSTLGSGTGAQDWLDATNTEYTDASGTTSATNAITVTTGRYEFAFFSTMTALASSGSFISFNLGGTSTFNGTNSAIAFGFRASGISVPANAINNSIPDLTIARQVGASNTSTQEMVYITGAFNVTVAGTIKPIFTQSATATPSVNAGSYFRITKIK